MNEKGLIVLEQYDLDVRNARRGRGSFLVETDKGLKILTECSGTEGRLVFISRVMHHLKDRGLERLDLPVASREGTFIVKDREDISYVLRDWYEGRECDVRSLGDIQEAVRILALLHRDLTGIFPEKEGVPGTGTSLGEEFGRKNAELRKVRKFIRSRQRKNSFEREFLDCFEDFYGEAKLAEQEALGLSAQKLQRESREKGCLCHGDFNQHHVLLSPEGTGVTEFGHCHYGVQMEDFSQFLRKILEKQDWDKVYGNAMIREYGKIRPLGQEEVENLRIRLLYPEKFWKLANHYNSSNKAWLPQKHTEKLRLLISQQNQKASFLKILE